MRYIAHVDMDAFFAAVEQRDNPKLRDKPVIVGANPKEGKGRGVVSTCSYEARKFGVCSGLPISIAFKKCPGAHFLPVDMEKYRRVSHEIYDILCNFTPQVEMASIDEAFLDITGSFHLFETPAKTCLLLKSKIRGQTGLNSSIGLAPTKMAAKIASDLHKPDAFVEVKQENLLEFLWPLDVGKLWGLGKKTEAKLRSMGINTIGELAKTNLEAIVKIFGKNGGYLWQLACGHDDKSVEIFHKIKSISNETTFSQDTSNYQKILTASMRLSEQVSHRLRRENLKGKSVTLKIRLQGFHTYTRSKTLIKATNYVDAIYKTIKKLFDDFQTEGKPVRLIGVRVSQLMPDETIDSLLHDEKDEKKERLHRAIESIQRKFGQEALWRATNTYPGD